MYNFYVAIIVQSIWFYVFLLFFRVEERMSGSDMSGYTDKDINTAKQLPKVEYLSFCKKHYSQKFILNCLIYSHMILNKIIILIIINDFNYRYKS